MAAIGLMKYATLPLHARRLSLLHAVVSESVVNNPSSNSEVISAATPLLRPAASSKLHICCNHTISDAHAVLWAVWP